MALWVLIPATLFRRAVLVLWHAFLFLGLRFFFLLFFFFCLVASTAFSCKRFFDCSNCEFLLLFQFRNLLRTTGICVLSGVFHLNFFISLLVDPTAFFVIKYDLIRSGLFHL
jgi:hypothetical protein